MKRKFKLSELCHSKSLKTFYEKSKELNYEIVYCTNFTNSRDENQGNYLPFLQS